jgi:hypothetical protein
LSSGSSEPGCSGNFAWELSRYAEGDKMPAEPGLVISSGRPRVPGFSAVSSSAEQKLCDSFAEKNLGGHP